MNLKLLNETHPLIEEAWMNGFEPVIQDHRVMVQDALPTSDEDPFEREKSRLDLEERMQSKAADVIYYLKSLDDIVVKIDSKILVEQIWIVGSKKRLSEVPPQELAYLPQEVFRIKKANWSDETLRKIHRIKKIFGGTILDIEGKLAG